MNTILALLPAFVAGRWSRFASAIRLVALCFCSTFILAAVGGTPAYALAFPGAMGFGANATGGTGGTVYTVTNLNDSGTGSFRDAVSAGNRIVQFSVHGYIVLASAVSCSSNITILGNTSSGTGIGIEGAEVSFSKHSNIICRYMRFRQGTLGDSGQSAVNIGGGSNMIFDHCSLEFGQWDSFDAVTCSNVTVQNCIIADPINQQFGAHVEGSNFTFINNLWVNCHNRQPLAKDSDQYIQNVIYNYELGYTVANTGGIFSHDIVNNYFITGPATTTPSDCFFQMNTGQSVYSNGNLLDSNNDGTLNGSTVNPSGVTVLTSPWASTTNSLTTMTAAQAYTYVLANAGDLPHDQLDLLVISQVQKLGHGTSGTGAGTDGPGTALYTSQTQTGLGNGGYGVIP